MIPQSLDSPLRKSGRSTKRPRATIAATANNAWPTTRPKRAALPVWAVGAIILRMNNTGTTAKS